MVIAIDVNKLNKNALVALAKGTEENDVLEQLVAIKDQSIHQGILDNSFASENVLKKLYDIYKNDEDMMLEIFYHCNCPENIIIEFLKKHNKDVGFGWLQERFFQNSNITEEIMKIVYDMYKEKSMRLDYEMFKELISDNRTGTDVLMDALIGETRKEVVYIIATHPKMRIVPATEVKS